MEELAPLRYAYDWDNSGVNLYLHDDVERILVCLEVTPAVVEEAAALGCDTIVCHHPMVFRPIKGLRKMCIRDRMCANMTWRPCATR